MNDSVIAIACPVVCDRDWGVLKVCIIDKTVLVGVNNTPVALLSPIQWQ